VQKKVEAGEVVTIHGNDQEIGTRFYIDSRMVAEAVHFIIMLGASSHKIGLLDEPERYNIVGDKDYSNLELAQLIAKLMGKELKYKLEDFHASNPAHDIHYGLDGRLLASRGWRPSKSFVTCLGEIIKWQQENKEWIS
jgi:dTDP-glucose 4,6-dehydratase